MAQVNCLAQGGKSPMTGYELTVDLCNSNGIKFCMSLCPQAIVPLGTDDRPSNNIV